MAVLLTDDGETMNIPRSLLPPAVKPGDVLTLTLEHDAEATRKLAEETRRVQDELSQRDPGGDIRLDETSDSFRLFASFWPAWRSHRPLRRLGRNGPGRGRRRRQVRRRRGARRRPGRLDPDPLARGQDGPDRRRTDQGRRLEGAQEQGDRAARPGGDQPSSQRPLRRDGGGRPRAEAALLPGVELRALDPDVTSSCSQTVEAQGITAIQPTSRPRKIELGSVELTIFPQAPEDRKEENNNSIGIRLKYGSFSVLLTGDSEEARAAMVAREPSRPGPGLHDPQAGPSRQPQRDRRALAGRGPARAGRGQHGPEQRVRPPSFRDAQPAAAQPGSPCSAPTSSARSRSRATAGAGASFGPRWRAADTPPRPISIGSRPPSVMTHPRSRHADLGPGDAAESRSDSGFVSLLVNEELDALHATSSRLLTARSPDRRHADACWRCSSIALGLAVEVVDLLSFWPASCRRRSSHSSSSRAASGSSRPIGASSAADSWNVACGTGTSWPRLSPLGEDDRPGLDELPVQREGIIEPPGLDDAFERVAVGLPAVAGPLEVEVPAGRGAEQPGRRERDDPRAELALDRRLVLAGRPRRAGRRGPACRPR